MSGWSSKGTSNITEIIKSTFILDEMKKTAPFMISHRGKADEAPENTLPAFQKSVEAGVFDWIEFDVMLSSDNEWVVIHDLTVDRTTNGTGNVADLTLAELKALDAGSWFDAEFAGTEIPTLEEALYFCWVTGIGAFIELKGQVFDEADLSNLIDICNTYNQRIFISSFENNNLVKVTDITDKYPVGKFANYVNQNLIDIVSPLPNSTIILDSDDINEANIDTLRAGGFDFILGYSINDLATVTNALENRIDGFVIDSITDLNQVVFE